MQKKPDILRMGLPTTIHVKVQHLEFAGVFRKLPINTPMAILLKDGSWVGANQAGFSYLPIKEGTCYAYMDHSKREGKPVTILCVTEANPGDESYQAVILNPVIVGNAIISRVFKTLEEEKKILKKLTSSKDETMDLQ